MRRTITLRLLVLGLFVLTPLLAYADYYWRGYTSEETEPSVCAFGDLVSGFGCRGSYCDNVRPECERRRLEISSRFWATQISEERTDLCQAQSGETTRCFNYMQKCSTTGFMSGVSCSGHYCDNLSLECVFLEDFTRTGCYWSSWISEENGGTILLPVGYYAAGMECSGHYCDNKRFYACRLRPRFDSID
jgi:hypothetical protein